MCRVIDCFDIEQREESALRMSETLRANTNDDTKTRIYTLALWQLDPRLVNWRPITDVFTGANKSDHVRRNRLFATETKLVTTLRQWSRKTKPDSLDHSQETRMAMIAGMLTQVISKSQHTAKMCGYNISARYMINDYGRAYLAWLEAREHEYHAAQDALYREAFEDVQTARYAMAGAL